MLTNHLALVAQTASVPMSAVTEVAAAVQRQITRDFAPIWGVSATVEPFDRLDQVPSGYWPIILREDLPGPNVLGQHLDDHGQPFALIQTTNIWSLTASHEAVEMLADPFGNRLSPGGSLRVGQGVVEFLVEVADPVAGVDCAYTVNGIMVSDFVTPDYYQHPTAVRGTSYSFTGAVRRPRDVVDGGYIAWREPLRGDWWQAGRTHGRLRVIRLGVIEGGRLGLRSAVDSVYTPPHLFEGVPEDDPRLLAALARRASEASAARARAGAWERQITSIVRPSGTRVGRRAPVASPSPGRGAVKGIDRGDGKRRKTAD
jgi:hypothetical protein